MPFISSRIFVAGGTKKLMTLQNEEHVRYIGTNWATVRIGLLCALQDNSGSNVTGRLAIGLCSGQSNPVGNATSTTNFLGVRTLSGGQTWTYTANSGNPYFTNGSCYGLWRTGNSDVTAGIATTTINVVTTATGVGSLQRRSLIIVDISKGGEAPFYTNTTDFGADYTVDDLIAAIEYSTSFQVPKFRGVTLAQSTTQTPAGFSEANGVLDSLDIHWSGTSQALEIYGMGVTRKT